jgi:hypothetical protein
MFTMGWDATDVVDVYDGVGCARCSQVMEDDAFNPVEGMQ